MRLANRCRLAGVALLLVLMGTGLGAARAADFSIEATVDRTKVKFGESLQLVITVTQAIGSGGGERLGAPQVSRIPGFDIAGQRTSHNMTIINGVGQVQLQTVVELVPQEPGNFNIPALQLQGPDGKVHATKPIAVTVLPPAPDEEAAAAPGSPDEEAVGDDSGDAPRGSRVGKILVVALFILGAIIGAPILLSYLLNRGARPSTRWQDEETATITGTTTGNPAASARPGPARPEGTRPARADAPIEDAVLAPPSRFDARGPAGSRPPGAEPAPARPAQPAPPEKVDFEREVTALQRRHPDADLEFYRAFFDLFRRSALGRSSRLDPNMTPDEMVKALVTWLPGPLGPRLRALADDWECVSFANSRPGRPWSPILEDALAVLAAIPPQE